MGQIHTTFSNITLETCERCIACIYKEQQHKNTHTRKCKCIKMLKLDFDKMRCLCRRAKRRQYKNIYSMSLFMYIQWTIPLLRLSSNAGYKSCLALYIPVSYNKICGERTSLRKQKRRQQHQSLDYIDVTLVFRAVWHNADTI